MGLFTELKRRRVLRTLALYILGAWVLMQVADVLLPSLGLPEESIRYLLFATIAGFPVALVFGWFFDITAEGIHRTAALNAGESATPEPLRATDYGLLAALLLLLGVVIYGVIGEVGEIPLPQTASEQRPPIPDGPPMVGVLPFAHIGSTEDGAFFASGIHDDLLTRLAKIRSLRIISRTSMLQYVDTIKPIPQIGRELRADAILEGGVRIAGNQIRINAQLIDARSDEHLWAETFDRELTASNIFDIQTDIAKAISRALQTTLSDEDNLELAVIPTSNMAAYRAFHEAMRYAAENSFLKEDRKKYVSGLQKAFELDPNFTRPMVEVIAALALDVFFKRGDSDLGYIESLVERIGEIAPDSADHLSAQSLYFYYVLRDYTRAYALIEQAQQRAPSDIRLINLGSWIQRRLGDFEGYLQSAQRAYALEPNNPETARTLFGRLATMHRYREALEISATLENPPLKAQLLQLKLALMEHGSLDRYQSELLAFSPEFIDTDAFWYYSALLEAQVALRDYADVRRTAATLSDILGERGARPGDLSYASEFSILLPLLEGDLEAAREIALAQKEVPISDTMPVNEYPDTAFAGSRALLAIALDKTSEAANLVSGMWHDPTMDRALWVSNRDQICGLLAMALAAQEATACLRDLLDQPSQSHPFLEPLQPYYDRIRKTPVFQELISELVAAGWIEA